jgi:hypothetical protein
VYIETHQRVLVTYASTTAPQLTVLDVSKPGSPTIDSSAAIVTDPKAGLPPRLIAWY